MAELSRHSRRSLLPRVFPEMDQLFRNLWGQPFWSADRGDQPAKWAPQVDLYETAEELVVKVELPGIAKEDVEVLHDGRDLAIRAERQKDEEVSEDGYYRRERVYGHFERLMQLPSDIVEDSLRAKFENGVLEVRATKKGPEPRGRKIEVG